MVQNIHSSACAALPDSECSSPSPYTKPLRHARIMAGGEVSRVNLKRDEVGAGSPTNDDLPSTRRVVAGLFCELARHLHAPLVRLTVDAVREAHTRTLKYHTR